MGNWIATCRGNLAVSSSSFRNVFEKNGVVSDVATTSYLAEFFDVVRCNCRVLVGRSRIFFVGIGMFPVLMD
jgi:hypothetical protein